MKAHLHHLITIDWEAKLDLVWWLDIFISWSSASLILKSQWTISPAMHLYTVASGSEGWDAFWNDRWLQDHWSPAQLSLPIVWKELFAIVNAVNPWGHLWTKKKIYENCPVLDIWHKGSTHNTATMALVHLLYFCAAHYHINIVITHIAIALLTLSHFQN